MINFTIWLLTAFAGIFATLESIEPEFRKDVFISGHDDYHTYRIPTIVKTNKGTVLAFCEARKNSQQDTGDIDLVLKRSTDNGESWSELILVHEEGGGAEITIGNPVPIVEQNSAKVHLFFTRNYRRIFYTFTIDEGKTWTKPEEFTHILDGFDYPNRVLIATGPVHGIQMKNGRLVVPVWICDRSRKERYKNITPGRIRSGVVYSDDSGRSWNAGGLVPTSLPILHEATVVERVDGSLLINMRAYDELYRAESQSKDGGITWSEPKLNKVLPDPTCQASLLKTTGDKILFLNPAIASRQGMDKRKNLTLKISDDQGETWSRSMVIYQGPSGYSDLVEVGPKSILCVYENGDRKYHEKISVAMITL